MSENKDYRTCAGCGKKIKPDQAVRYTATRGIWHEGCYRR